MPRFGEQARCACYAFWNGELLNNFVAFSRRNLGKGNKVDGDHVYRVGEQGLLVHNASAGQAQKDCPPASDASGRVAYGTTDLSRSVQLLRASTGNYSGRNVAVLEYCDDNGQFQYICAFSRSVPQFREGQDLGHSERRLARELDRRNIPYCRVTRIYSELSPCIVPNNCDAFVTNNFPMARVTWSFEYGADQASRDRGTAGLNAAVAALRTARTVSAGPRCTEI
jgi:Xanthomonas XOO_2897-like deaminase